MAQTISAKRIASFLPSATEILYELGAGDQLVGVTHECDYPEEAKSKPRVIKSSFDHTKMNSKEIDNQISNMMQSGSDIYLLDEQVLKKASPDLIIGQGLCDVCSPATKEISKAVSILDVKPKSITSRPKVLCIEWLDPLFTAGHWVPQMVEIAGGINGISVTGERSRRMKIEEAMNFEPDTIVLMPCGFDINRIRQEYPKLASDSQWKLIPAVQTNHVYAVDANSYFSKPGPRTVTGIEILAKIIHPEVFVDLKIPDDSFVQ